MNTILAIDPGTTESGWVLFDAAARRVLACGKDSNQHMLTLVQLQPYDQMAVEMVASYGKPVGAETFGTVLWAGRMIQASRDPDSVTLVYRADVKMHLCASPRAKDTNIRQALIDLLGAPGTKKNPGPLYGVTGDCWAALAVAVTFARLERTRASVGGIREFA